MSDDLGDALKRAGSKKLRDGLTAAAGRKAAEERGGSVTFTGWKGPWSPEASYERGNVVSHEGSSWRAVADHSGSEPPSQMWSYVAKRGEKGPQGPRGADGIGAAGPQGPPGPGGTPATTVESETTFGIVPAVGTDLEYARQDHTHGSPAAPVIPDPADTVVTETTFGQASAVGVGTEYAREDHTHGTPTAPSVPVAGNTVVTGIAYGQASAAGVDADFSREDHTHGTPAVPAHNDLSGVTANQHHNEDHDHDGSPTQKLVQANTHNSPDTDAAPTSLHHTLGTGANQAAAGNHAHAGLIIPLLVSTSTVSVINTTTETALLSQNLPSCASADVLDFELAGTYLNNTATARWMKFRVKIGATTLLAPLATPANFGGTSANTRRWTLHGRIILGVTTEVTCELFANVSVAGGAVLMDGASSWVGSVGETTVTDLSTAGVLLEVTAEHEVANASISIVRQSAALHLLR